MTAIDRIGAPPEVPGRRKLPGRRRHVGQKATLGSTSVDVGLSLDQADQPVEVWIDVAHREGAPLRTVLQALARVCSIALQYGAPTLALAKVLRFTSCEPAGEVTGVDGVAYASSIPDLVGQILQKACLSPREAGGLDLGRPPAGSSTAP